MNCPYCAEQVKDSAIVCKHCGRELFVVRPLMAKLDEAARRLEVLEAGLPEDQRADIARMIRPTRPRSILPGLDPLAAVSLSLILLVFAHFIIIVEFNLSLVYLRIVSIVVPLVFGLLCRESGRKTLAVELLYGAILAVLAILFMAALVGRLDHVPMLPRDKYEWREFLEYGASIMFGFFTGAIIRQTVIAMRSTADIPNRLIAVLARIVSDKLGGEAAGFNMKTVQSLLSAGLAAGSAIASLVTGLRQFFF